MLEGFFNVTGFSIERLETFCRVAQLGSIKNAADADPTRQSQYSRQIRDLERALGVTLFDRSGKKWRLTDEGRQLVVIARGFFQSIGNLQESIRADRFHLRIGAGDGVFAWYLGPSLESIQHAKRGVTFECRNLRTQEIVRQLLEGEIDVGVLRADAVPDELTTRPYVSISYSLFVPRNLLPEKSAAGFDLLRELPMARLSGSGLHQRRVDAILENKGVTVQSFFEAGSFVLLYRAMRLMGLAGVLPSAAEEEISEEVFAKIDLEELAGIGRKLVIANHPEMAVNNPLIETVAHQLSSHGSL